MLTMNQVGAIALRSNWKPAPRAPREGRKALLSRREDKANKLPEGKTKAALFRNLPLSRLL